MNKMYTLVSALLLTTAGSALAQGTELFFSEYDEGAQASASGMGTPCPNAPNSSGNERAMEIFNPTMQAVDLSKYSVRRYSNGGTTPFQEERLQRTTGPNTLAAGATFVYGCGEATIPDIISVADQLCAPYSSTAATVITGGGPMYFNGNDAMVLVRWTGSVAGQGTPIIVDIFGIIGHNPGGGTSSGGQWVGLDASGVQVITSNQSLVRRDTISSGDVTWNLVTTPSLDPATFNPGDEWEMYSTAFPGGVSDPCAQQYNDLGQHTYNGPRGQYNTSLSLMEEFNNAIQFYPNPASGRVNVALGTAKVGKLTVMNNLGRTISTRPTAGEATTSLDVSGLAPGLYLVRCQSADGKISIYKELVVQ
jgi:Secretion system C-terminal sorting domain